MSVMGRSTRSAALVLATIGALAMPAVAGAATLDGAGGVLTYTAAGGQANFVAFNATATPGTVAVVNSDSDAITPSGTCAPAVPVNTYECTGITSIAADAGDLNDVFDASTSTIASALVGGAGDDQLDGGSANDRINGGDGQDSLFGGGGDDSVSGGTGDDFTAGGDGNDALDGGDGDDGVFGGAGADDLRGGTGVDSTSYFGSADPAPDINVSLDDQPNDGAAGEGDNTHSDIEDVFGGSQNSTTSEPGNVTLTGSPTANSLAVGFGRGNITGGLGNDMLSGGQHDDTITARDGFADRVTCGAGSDTAVVDNLDVVSTSCENVQSEDVGNANEDKPPTVTFDSPAANGATIATAAPTTLTATASDDRGVAKVQFLDDDRIVCEDATAPYSCAYSPRGEDVGRNTLSVMAIDTSQQTATAFRTTAVGRFAARDLTLRVSPRRDRSGPFRFRASGRLQLPAGVSAALGCRGAVSVQVKAGRRTISSRRVRLTSDCTYSLRVTFRNRARFTGSGALRLRSRYQGNTVLRREASQSVRARTR